MAMRLDPPCDVIRALAVAAQPSSTSTTCFSCCRVQNWDGATPLHIAASHRCSARALTTLLQVSSSTTSSVAAVAAAKPTALDLSEKYGQEEESETEPSVLSTLSRTGRAPIHYACSSFRGLELEAFKILFEATLKDGNLRLLQTKEDRHKNDEEKLAAALNGDEDVDFWLGEEGEEQGSNHDDNDDMVQDFRKEEEIMRMIMDDEEYHEYDDDVQAQQPQQGAHEITHQQQQVVVVNVLGLKDATGQTPLGLLFRRYRERVRHVINRIDRIHDAATAAVQRDALRRRGNSSSTTSTGMSGRERLRRASLVASLTVQGELGELWSKARWIVARLTQERLEREQDWKYYPGPKTTQEAAATSACQKAADWAAEQCQSSFSRNNPLLQDEHSDFFVPVPMTMNTMKDKKMPAHESKAAAVAATSTSTSASTAASRKFRIVHASVGLTGFGCPPEMIRLAISVHPHQVYEMDEEGNLPIHIAAMASSHLASAEDANNCNSFSDYLAAASLADSGGGAAGDDHSVLSDAMNSFFSSATISQTTNPFDKVIKILLQHYPQAAQIPQGKFPGKLPLVLAMEQHEQHQLHGRIMVCGGIGGNRRASWEDGIRTLLNAHPAALHSSNRKHDITLALYPHVLALIAEDYVMPTSRFPSLRLLSLPLMSTSRQQQHHYRLPQRSSSTSKLLRREACARTTVFELLRTKPEWLGATADE
jgi:hypothetical protein